MSDIHVIIRNETHVSGNANFTVGNILYHLDACIFKNKIPNFGIVCIFLLNMLMMDIFFIIILVLIKGC